MTARGSPSGEVTHLIGIIHDITRLKAAEEALRQANDDLERRVRERTAALEIARDGQANLDFHAAFCGFFC